MGSQPSGAAVRTTVDDLLAEARRDLQRLEPTAAAAAISSGALLVDIRSEVQRHRDGLVPGSVFVARNVLEWRCDPACSSSDPRLADLDRQLILMCDEGYQSSLAAATLRRVGFSRATDLVGGFQAWRRAGLPVSAAR
jgi:rhodanese-related sulfurtransferase